MDILYKNDQVGKNDDVPAANSRTGITLKTAQTLLLTLRQGVADFKNTPARTIPETKLGGADWVRKSLLKMKNHIPLNFRRQNGYDLIGIRTVFKSDP